jgi:hypothetical protein
MSYANFTLNRITTKAQKAEQSKKGATTVPNNTQGRTKLEPRYLGSYKQNVKEQRVNTMAHRARILAEERKILSSSLPLFG